MIYTEDDFWEAEFKLQNTIRVTTFVEDFKVEVNTGRVWAPVTEYVVALLEYERKKAVDDYKEYDK